MKKTLDFYRYVSKDKCRYFMTGVYHKDGYKWATNGCVALKVKEDYPEKFEGKIVTEQLTYVDGQFPNVQKIIPDMEDMVEITDLSPNEVLIKEFKALKPMLSIHKKISGYWNSFRYILPNGSEIMVNVWELALHFIEVYPDAKMYCHKEDGYRPKEENSLVLISGDAMFIFMPAVHLDDTEKHSGFYWQFDNLTWEDHDEFNFLRVLSVIGSKGIAERYQLGNLTDKDNKLIDNLYRYLEIVGYDYKREVA